MSHFCMCFPSFLHWTWIIWGQGSVWEAPALDCEAPSAEKHVWAPFTCLSSAPCPAPGSWWGWIRDHTMASPEGHQKMQLTLRTFLVLFALKHTVLCTLSCSVVCDSATPWTVTRQAPLCSWGFSRQEHWSGLPCPLQENTTSSPLFPEPGSEWFQLWLWKKPDLSSWQWSQVWVSMALISILHVFVEGHWCVTHIFQAPPAEEEITPWTRMVLPLPQVPFPRLLFPESFPSWVAGTGMCSWMCR